MMMSNSWAPDPLWGLPMAALFEGPPVAEGLGPPRGGDSLQGADSWESAASLGAAGSGLWAEPRRALGGTPPPPGAALRGSTPAVVAGRLRQASDFVPSPDLQRAFCLLPPPAPTPDVRPRWRWQPSSSAQQAATYGLMSRDPDRPVRLLRLPGWVEAAAWSPDGEQLALGVRRDGPRRWQNGFGAAAREPGWQAMLVNAKTGALCHLPSKNAGQARLRWSPEGSLLAVLDAPRSGQDSWHHLNVWSVDLAAPRPSKRLDNVRWPVPVEVSFSRDGRYLMLHIFEGGLHVQRNVIDMHDLPPPPGGTAVPSAGAVAWSSTNDVLFARNGSFARLGTAGRWTPAAALSQEAPFVLGTGWNVVHCMRTSQLGNRTAVLTQDAGVGAADGEEAQLHALLSTLECPAGRFEPALRLGAQVRLRGPLRADDANTTLMSWAPRGPHQDHLAVAPPFTNKLWLVDSADGGAPFELARDLGGHRWAGWSLCGEYLLVTDETRMASSSRLSSVPAVRVPVARLRVYQMGWRRPVVEELRKLSPAALGMPAQAFAEANLARIIWLLPESTETIDFIDPA